MRKVFLVAAIVALAGCSSGSVKVDPEVAKLQLKQMEQKTINLSCGDSGCPGLNFSYVAPGANRLQLPKQTNINDVLVTGINAATSVATKGANAYMITEGIKGLSGVLRDSQGDTIHNGDIVEGSHNSDSSHTGDAVSNSNNSDSSHTGDALSNSNNPDNSSVQSAQDE